MSPYQISKETLLFLNNLSRIFLSWKYTKCFLNIWYSLRGLRMMVWPKSWFNFQELSDHDEEVNEDNRIISFSSSAFPHYTKRRYTYEDLRQLYRSVGCVGDEIRVECLHDENSMVVIENATFYAVPNEEWLNCTRGPSGPLAMGGLVESVTDSGLQNSIFAGVSGFSSLTTAR